MTHLTLIKHGWKVIFEGKHFTAYELEGKMLVLWLNGIYKVYDTGDKKNE